MKKVLHVSFGGLGYGGVSSVIFSIVEALNDKFKFDCVVFKQKCEREDIFKKYGKLYRINAYNNGARNYWEIIFRPIILYIGIYKICKNNNYDVIHCHNGFDEGVCLLAAKHAGVTRRIAHSHNTFEKLSLLMRIKKSINNFIINRCATECIGCSSNACEDFFSSKFYRVIYNCIDLNKFDIKYKKNHNNINFIHVGRYSYPKNQVKIVEIYNHLSVLLPESRLFLIGTGSDKDIIEQKVKEYNLQNRIKLIEGTEKNVMEFYSIGDYMIFPSKYEGFGIVLLEAQSMGIPCFVSERIQKEVNLGLLKFINLDKSSREWAKIIFETVKKEKFNYRNVEKMKYLYSLEYVGDQYEKLYNSIEK